MSAPFSYLSHLECSLCGERRNPAQLHTFCSACGAPLLARYDLSTARAQLDRDEFARGPGAGGLPGMWRWHALLPVRDPDRVITLGEGSTPILTLERLGQDFGLRRLTLKDEGINPTGSFKARGLSAAISKAGELGVQKVVIPTAGNAGGAMAAYAARAGMQAAVFMPTDTPAANRKESRFCGAETILVPGLISDAAVRARTRAQEDGFFDVSTFKEPYRAEGKKVMGFEIAAAFGWQLPDWIFYPTGGGTGLVGIWKAIQELDELGWLDTPRKPRMVAVQADGCAPVVRAFTEKRETCAFWEGAATLAAGLRVPKPFADRLILSTLRESGGTALAVSDDAIRTAQRQLAEREGLFTAPEGAATLAGLSELLKNGAVQPDDRILLLNTGTGLKYLDQIDG